MTAEPAEAAASDGALPQKDPVNEEDEDDVDDVERGLRGDQPPQAALSSHTSLARTAFLTLGIVFGDIGTSTLYTFTSIFQSGPPQARHVIGALSLCLWTLFIVCVLKYLCFVLLADDHGEGGIFALYNVVSKGLRNAQDRRWDEALAVVALVGLSAMCAEGIITPAISVLSAVEGLAVVSPVLAPLVTPLSVTILALFFAVQSLGTKRISFLFSPITLVWFAALFTIGVYNTSRNPSVLVAINPAHAVRYVAEEGGLEAMGSVFLTVTGAEALYGDLGHFSARAIRTSAWGVVLPALFACYCGQAAALLEDPSIYGNVFFQSLPKFVLRPMVLLSTLAAIIASQAMVSASFSLLNMAVIRGSLPRLKVIRTNALALGQVYVPLVNSVYMTLSIAIVLAFGSSAALGDAYGVAVSTLFCITTVMFTLAIVVHFKQSPALAALFFFAFGTVDLAFFAANALKLWDGGWVTVLLAATLLSCSLAWRWGRAATAQVSVLSNAPQEPAMHQAGVLGVAPRLVVVLNGDARPLGAVTVQMGVRPDKVVKVFLHTINEAAHYESCELQGEDSIALKRGVFDGPHDVGAAVAKHFPGWSHTVLVSRERAYASPMASLARRSWVAIYALMLDVTPQTDELVQGHVLEVVVNVEV